MFVNIELWEKQNTSTYKINWTIKQVSIAYISSVQCVCIGITQYKLEHRNSNWE